MNIYGCALLLPAFFFAAGAYASNDLSSCSSLIPDDHDYQVVVKYDFTHGGKMKKFVGITDKNARQLTKEQEDKAKPFVDCVKGKIKLQD